MFDCVIVGGGPAGLTCAIFLGRYRRRVLVVDAGKPRNYASHGIHGFLGQDSIPPAELLEKGRAEAERYGVKIISGRAEKIERDGDTFRIFTSEGRVRARRTVLAYGVRDRLPDLPEIERWYGSGVYHCPDCDGYEVRDRKIALIGWGRNAARLALDLLVWSEDVELFTDGHASELTEEDHSKLEAEGIRICDRKLKGISSAGDQITGLDFEDEGCAPVEAIFFSIGAERSCLLAEEIGCDCSDGTIDVRVDEHCRTSVEGVWAIGDLTAGSKLAITAAADGAIAAISINKSLLPPARRVED